MDHHHLSVSEHRDSNHWRDKSRCVLVGLSAFGASFLAVVAAGGLKFGLFWGDSAQKIGVPIVAVLLLAFAYWLSGGFAAQLFGVALSGEAWAIIGGLVGFVCVNRGMAA